MVTLVYPSYLGDPGYLGYLGLSQLPWLRYLLLLSSYHYSLLVSEGKSERIGKSLIIPDSRVYVSATH